MRSALINGSQCTVHGSQFAVPIGPATRSRSLSTQLTNPPWRPFEDEDDDEDENECERRTANRELSVR